MDGDAGENILEPEKGINSSALAGGHEAPQHRGGLAAFIAAKEYPVVSAPTATPSAAQMRCCFRQPCPDCLQERQSDGVTGFLSLFSTTTALRFADQLRQVLKSNVSE